jgi:hypothetical protein
MLTNLNDRSLTPFKVGLLLALATEVVTVALLFQDREIWFGIRASQGVQFVFFLIVSIATLVYMIRAHFRFTNDYQESITTIITQAHAGVERACTEAERCLSALEEQVTKIAAAADASLQNGEETRPAEFELAYQVRVAMDCIRFAIRATEQSVEEPNQVREASLRQEANLQLLDALDRLQSAERRFQGRFRFHSSDAAFGIGSEVPWPVEERIREAGS